MSTPLPPYLDRAKLISELLMALERHVDKYTGIQRKRILVQIRDMKMYLAEIKENPPLNYMTEIGFKDGIFYV